jgi:hypothetical protein
VGVDRQRHLAGRLKLIDATPSPRPSNTTRARLLHGMHRICENRASLARAPRRNAEVRHRPADDLLEGRSGHVVLRVEVYRICRIADAARPSRFGRSTLGPDLAHRSRTGPPTGKWLRQCTRTR